VAPGQQTFKWFCRCTQIWCDNAHREYSAISRTWVVGGC